jgi:hypothetical protein
VVEIQHDQGLVAAATRICKRKVGSSILSSGTNNIRYLSGKAEAMPSAILALGKFRGRFSEATWYRQRREPEVRFWQP